MHNFYKVSGSTMLVTLDLFPRVTHEDHIRVRRRIYPTQRMWALDTQWPVVPLYIQQYAQWTEKKNSSHPVGCFVHLMVAFQFV